jgi:DNA repair protein SbcD/Mre11
LHIDSPFAGLGVKDADVAARFARAGRKAVEALVAQAIAEKSAFLIIAGDIFDGDWKDFSTGLFFARVMGELDRAQIPVFIVKGNHDAENLMSRKLGLPACVTNFGSGKASTVRLEALQVALHGRSFPARAVPDDFVESYPRAVPGFLNIGILHTALDGTHGHATYAPCTPEGLTRFGYDYWALGHIHTPQIISENPWIVYPGNIQGRSVRETGAKGAMRVTVEDGRIVEVTPIVLDGARWALGDVDVSCAEDEAAVLACVDARLAAIHADAGERPLAVRLQLTGMSALHTHLVARHEGLEADARALGFGIAADCWVEQLKIATHAPPRVVAAVDGLDVAGLLAGVAEDAEFDAVIGELLGTITDKMPRDMRDVLGGAEVRRQWASEARDLLSGLLAEPGSARHEN